MLTRSSEERMRPRRGFTLVESLIALSLAAGGLALAASLLAALVSQSRRADENRAAGVALQTVEAHLKSLVPETWCPDPVQEEGWGVAADRLRRQRWRVDRSGLRPIGEGDGAETWASAQPESAAFFEVAVIPCGPDGRQDPVLGGGVVPCAIQVSWPVWDGRGRLITDERRNRRLVLGVFRP
ncbi:MAG: prepilin-type N-terminal cleavage/methylation domain-containing protein [Opitutaceae bacterium]